MEAGRALDALVAGHVMGWTAIQKDAYTPIGREYCGTPPPGVVPMWATGRSAVPHYSTDIRTAWQVVEKLRDMWTEATEGASDLNLPGHFRSFIAPFDDGAFFDVLHRNADRRWPWAFLYVTPAAICWAALAAVGYDPDEEL